MKAAGWGLCATIACVLAAGCVPTSDLVNQKSINSTLSDENRAWQVEIENLKAHSRQVEDQLIRAEQELAARDQADAAHGGVAASRRLPSEVSQQLALWARQYPNLSFDAATGASKCDIDVLFDSGQTELRPAARQMLSELAQVLQRSEARDLKIMIVGHTDNQRIIGVSTREHYPNNFHLSTARALAVADVLRTQGLSDQRIGVAGFGAHEPVSANQSALDRQKNRRVEIFVLPRDVPVVGWGEGRQDGYY